MSPPSRNAGGSRRSPYFVVSSSLLCDRIISLGETKAGSHAVEHVDIGSGWKQSSPSACLQVPWSTWPSFRSVHAHRSRQTRGTFAAGHSFNAAPDFVPDRSISIMKHGRWRQSIPVQSGALGHSEPRSLRPQIAGCARDWVQDQRIDRTANPWAVSRTHGLGF